MFATGLFSENFALSEKGTVSVDDNGKTTFKAGDEYYAKYSDQCVVTKGYNR